MKLMKIMKRKSGHFMHYNTNNFDLKGRIIFLRNINQIIKNLYDLK